MPLRSQLPGSSPLPAGALVRGLTRSLVRPGPVAEELRASLGRRFRGEPYLLGSGTQALQAALEVATAIPGLGEGPVAVPAYSCYDVVSACVGAGVRAVFYDVDPRTLSPDGESLEAAISQGARVVVAGNLYGFPLDWGALRAWVESVEGFLIEDAAQGVGSEWDGRPGGTFGDATVLSFGRGKGWTGGGGGALLLRDRRAEALGLDPPAVGPSSWGVRPLVGSIAQWALGRPALYGLPRAVPGLGLGETVYKAPSPPTPISAFSAALVQDTARVAEHEVEVRRAAAAVWRELPPTRGWTVPEVVPRGVSSYLRFPIVTDDASIRGHLHDVLDRFGAAAGYPQALPDLPQAQGIAGFPPRTGLEGARILAARLLTLPTHSRVGDRDRRGIMRALQRATPR